MALDRAPHLIESQRPSLTLLRGRKPDHRTAHGDALMEAIAFMDETVAAVSRLVHAEIARDVPSMVVINEANRLAYRAAAAKVELLDLTDPRGAA